MFDPVILLIGIAAFVAFLCCLYLLAVKPSWGIGLCLSTAVGTAFTRDTALTAVGGANITLLDVVSGALILNLLYRPPTLKSFGGAKVTYYCLVVMTVMFFLSVARGFVEYGNIKAVINESRRLLFALSTIWYIASLRATPGTIVSLCRQAVNWGVLLTAIALLRYGGVLTYGMAIVEESSGVYVQRVLPSNDAFYLAGCVVITWCLASARLLQPYWRWTLIAFPLIVIVLQHRSVWISLGIMGFGALFATRGLRGKAYGMMVTGALALIVLLAVAPSSHMAISLSTSLETTSGSKSTAAWRESGWIELLSMKSMKSPFNYVIGMPTGAGFPRYLWYPNGHVWKLVFVEPHNCYVYFLLRQGIIGMSAFIILMADSVWRLWKRGLFGRSFSLIQIGMMGYYTAYSFDEPQAFFTGIAILCLRILPEVQTNFSTTLASKAEPKIVAYKALTGSIS